MSRSPGVLRVLALASLLAAPGLAQDGGASPSGECMPSREAHECAERCPRFDTCFVAMGNGQLYYQVDERRFDCAGLECGAANQALTDYCCGTEEVVPPPPSGNDGGGGCALTSSGTSSKRDLGLLGVLGAGLLGLAARGRRLTQ